MRRIRTGRLGTLDCWSPSQGYVQVINRFFQTLPHHSPALALQSCHHQNASPAHRPTSSPRTTTVSTTRPIFARFLPCTHVTSPTGPSCCTHWTLRLATMSAARVIAQDGGSGPGETPSLIHEESLTLRARGASHVTSRQRRSDNSQHPGPAATG
jgi:hypothetical protein